MQRYFSASSSYCDQNHKSSSSKRRNKFQIAQQDYFTYAASLGLSATAFIFVVIEGGQYFYGVVVGMLLILTGFAGSSAFRIRQDAAVPNLQTEAGERETINIAALMLTALFLFIAFSYLVPQIGFASQNASYTTFYGQFVFALNTPLPSLNGVSIPTWIPAFVFIAILIPNAEEQFFRGFWGNLSIAAFQDLEGMAAVIGGMLGIGASVLLGFLITFLASIPGGALFGLFHAPVFNGNIPVLVTLALDGAVMISLNSTAGRLSVSVGAHMLNNAISFFITQASVLSLFLPVWHGFGMFIAPMGLIGIVLWRKYRA